MVRTKCMNCSGNDLECFLDLSDQPNGNRFITEDEIADEPSYPLKMDVCKDCWQVQIDAFPGQEILFDDHPYVSGVNVPVVEHFKALAASVQQDIGFGKGDIVLDIGSNDGSLLSAFRALGATTIGVDPGLRVTQLARENGHLTCRAFWNGDTARSLRALSVTPKIISATAVFYHVPDLHDFIEGLKVLMADDTVFVVQGVSMLDVITKNQFDHFYHEHSCIHSVSALTRLFGRHGMTVFDAMHHEIHGGSFVAYVAKDTAGRSVSPRVEAFLEREREGGLESLESYHAFAKRVETNVGALRALLSDLKAQGRSVMGLGAPLKGSTLLNYGKIGPDLISALTEVNDFKIGRLAPGVHIPVIDERTLVDEPDYYVVLAWNFLDFFVEKKRDYLESGGKLIVPVPELRVIGKDDV